MLDIHNSEELFSDISGGAKGAIWGTCPSCKTLCPG